MKQWQYMRSRYSGSLALLLLCVLVSCQLPSLWQIGESTPNELPRGGTVTMALSDQLDVVQPWNITNRASEMFVSLTHAGLMRLDDRGMPQPELLADWTTSSDQTVITATLKADLQWSNATPLTSADVVYTYATLKTLPVTSPLLAELAVIQAVTGIDDTHVRFTLQRPYTPLVSLWALPILPAQVLASQQLAQVNMRNLLTSAGPFVYKEQRADGAVVLVANSTYVLGAPLLDSIVLLPKQSDAQMMAGVRAGAIDIAELSALPEPGTTTTLSSTTYAQNSMVMDVFNMRQGHPTSDVRVRQALAAAAPYQLRDIVVPESWVHGVLTTTQAMTDVVALLDSTGWVASAADAVRQRDGVPLAISLLVPADNAMLMQHADALVAQWQAWGIVPDRHNVGRDEYLAALIPPYHYDVMLMELAAGRSSSSYADVLFYEPDVRALFDASQRNAGIPDIRGSLNFSGVQDSAITTILVRLQSAYSIDSRQQLYRDLVTALERVVPVAVRSRTQTMVIYGNRVFTSTGSMRFNSPWYGANAVRWYVQPAQP